LDQEPLLLRFAAKSILVVGKETYLTWLLPPIRQMRTDVRTG